MEWWGSQQRYHHCPQLERRLERRRRRSTDGCACQCRVETRRTPNSWCQHPLPTESTEPPDGSGRRQRRRYPANVIMTVLDRLDGAYVGAFYRVSETELGSHHIGATSLLHLLLPWLFVYTTTLLVAWHRGQGMLAQKRAYYGK